MFGYTMAMMNSLWIVSEAHEALHPELFSHGIPHFNVKSKSGYKNQQA